jgi:trans-aconitate 2-methyltransferase
MPVRPPADGSQAESTGMPSWNSQQYLKFETERTRPCRDLIARIPLANPGRIVDLGCGPGNSTRALAERWPRAELLGIDSSAEMIEAAWRTRMRAVFEQQDIGHWCPWSARYNLVFSNAALQWVPGHERVLPQLLAVLAPGGCFAVQVPCNLHAPAHQIVRDIARSSAWRDQFPEGGVREWHVHDAGFYYDLLAPRVAEIDLWQTTYLHVLPGPEAIVEWYRGTGLRPYLDLLPEDRQEDFLVEYGREIALAYPRQADGRVLLPFERLLFVATQAP